ncbi:hypothetical protein [Pseudomonas borbori]|uniref:Uncharacterized protein n=1 Tax=Pseudomonas borbori TaxID=289003 RepID=A0A1I5WHR4_9PSED|nr:hypothetical protein [Pseudomonas borbori]SFQ19353.1 hypothetical protein SAMN05216190_14010 [Pseudomonas borbori]
MFERLRFLHRPATLPSGQTCNAAARVVIGRYLDVQRARDRIAQQRERRP